jgi:hypothetical protein
MTGGFNQTNQTTLYTKISRHLTAMPGDFLILISSRGSTHTLIHMQIRATDLFQLR